MVIEATMICLDNSEWMRNGDYAPNRFRAQDDAVNLICKAKILSNPKNTIGVMTMAGKGPRVLVTPTNNLGNIIASMHDLQIGGEMDLTRGIQIAQLALKQRQNKSQQQRIIVFAGSPVKCDQKTLEGIGNKLKENSVSLDVVEFGQEDDEKSEKLEALVAAVNNNGSSHIVHVPPGPRALSDVLLSTPIFTGDGDGGSGFAAEAAAAAAAAAAGGMSLALSSMEGERARQETAANRAAEDAAKQEKGGETSRSHDAIMAKPFSSSTLAADDKRHDLADLEAALLAEIRAMSLDRAKTGGVAITDTDIHDATGVDSDLALALKMSVEDSSKKGPSVQNSEKKDPYPNDLTKVLEDGSFVSTILNSLPGVDTNDPSLRELLASLQGKTEAAEKKNEDNTENEEEK